MFGIGTKDEKYIPRQEQAISTFTAGADSPLGFFSTSAYTHCNMAYRLPNVLCFVMPEAETTFVISQDARLSEFFKTVHKH